MDKASVEALIAQIYSAASGRTPWEVALTELCLVLDAWAVQILGLDKQTGGILFSHVGGGATLSDHLAYVRTYNRIDPRAPLLLSSTFSGWIHCHEHLSEDMVANNAFYQDFLIPAGGRYVSGTKITDDESLTVVLGVHRGVGNQPLGEKEIAFLEKLRAHLVEAMAIYRYLAARQFESSVGYAILERLHHPTVLIDTNRSIRFANATAKRTLAAKQRVSDHQGFLACVNVNDHNNLVAEIIDMTHAGINSNRRYMRLESASVGICLSALRPEEVMGAFGNTLLLMVVFHDTVNTATPDPFMLAEVFDLTPAEVQVAMAISEGHSLEDIARQRNVAIETIRAQLKTVFSKTQTNRQSDLVRRLLALAPV